MSCRIQLRNALPYHFVFVKSWKLHWIGDLYTAEGAFIVFAAIKEKGILQVLMTSKVDMTLYLLNTCEHQTEKKKSLPYQCPPSLKTQKSPEIPGCLQESTERASDLYQPI